MANLREATARRLLQQDCISPCLPSSCDCDCNNSIPPPPIPGALIKFPIATDTAIGGVMIDNKTTIISKEGVLSVKITEGNGLFVADEGIFLSIANKENSGAMTPEQVTKLENIAEGAQANVIEGAMLGTEGEAKIDENKKLILPVAGAFLGLVKSSNENNNISINKDGTMTINKISVSKLYVSDGDELILDGGNK